MKKVTLTLIVLAFTTIFAWAEGDKQEIQPSKLPKFTQSIIQSYFPGVEVATASKEKSKMRNGYAVKLSNGVVMECDKDGQWTMVDCGTEPVPDRLVPGKVKMFMSQKGIESTVVKMQMDKKGNYVIDLHDGTKLHFDNQFRYIE